MLFLSYLKFLNFNKALNYIKLRLDYQYYKLRKRNFLNTKPASISIETSAICNLACPACALGSKQIERTNSFFDYEKYEEIINEYKKHLISINLFFQGEPFLNKDIFKFINLANQKKIFSIISTNGFKLSENAEKIVKSGLSKLIISIDGIDENTYTKYRVNASFENLIEGIKTLVEEKKKQNSKFPILESQFLVMQHNEHQIEDYKIWAKSMGFDIVKLKSLQIYDSESISLLPSKPEYSRYKFDAKKELKIKSKLKNKCFRMFSSFVITSGGDVVPCCFDKNANYAYGDINENKLVDIVNSSVAKNFKTKVFTERKNIDICKNCTEGLRIKY